MLEVDVRICDAKADRRGGYEGYINELIQGDDKNGRKQKICGTGLAR